MHTKTYSRGTVIINFDINSPILLIVILLTFYSFFVKKARKSRNSESDQILGGGVNPITQIKVKPIKKYCNQKLELKLKSNSALVMVGISAPEDLPSITLSVPGVL